MWLEYKGEQVWREEIKGKLNWFSPQDIQKIDQTIDLENVDEKHLYDVLEEFMLEQGFVMFDNDFAFDREFENPNGWTERRYHCMVLHYSENKLLECGIQFWHIE